MLQKKRHSFMQIMPDCFTNILTESCDDKSTIIEDYLSKINVLEQENRRLMSAQFRLVKETNRRTEEYQAQISRFSSNSASLKQKYVDLQRSYADLVNRNYILCQMLRNNQFSIAPSFDQIPNKSQLTMDKNEKSKIFKCDLNNVSDDSTRSQNLFNQAASNIDSVSTKNETQIEIYGNLLAYIKRLEGRIKRIEHERSAYSRYSISDPNFSSLSPPGSSGNYSRDDSPNCEPILSKSTEKEDSCLSSSNGEHHQPFVDVDQEGQLESSANGSNHEVFYNGGNFSLHKEPANGNEICVEVEEQMDNHSLYENDQLADSTLSPIMEEAEIM